MRPDLRRATPADVEDCVRICRELPEYFTDEVADKMRADLGRHDGWVIADAGEVMGFAVVDRRTPRAVEIL